MIQPIHEHSSKWEYIGHRLMQSCDLFELCEIDRSDADAEQPFVTLLQDHELYGMITFVLERMKEIDAAAHQLWQEKGGEQVPVPLDYRGRELEYFRLQIEKTEHYRSSELYNAEFIDEQAEGYETLQGVYITLQRALRYLFDEIRFRYGKANPTFLGRIRYRYPDYAELIEKAKDGRRFNERSRKHHKTKEDRAALRIHLDQDQFDELYGEFCKFFDAGEHEDLKRLLQGEPVEGKITFQSNQNRLVEVFRRLKYNGFLFETSTGIRDWLCNNFLYLSKTGGRNLNQHSVWDILSKAKGEPSPKSRICKFEWLEYKTPAVFK
ncbi:MAG: hypothetical protein ISR54_07645 [Chlorobium phaeobacteroides]|uniref:Uncharacterized protein n=1 Tax=Chlorobium phaeobacteroides (strain BS1) TaxID=331678 RepID=B3ENA5_CHLPB|nr:hypothetical protein [Chlorobium phaeobacteroides]